jgi:UDP-N-acetyl-2-amino-2-deoxyglucuronate dehydrogenase
MGEKIKFAVIGCGHIGKRHAEMISRNDEAELIALADIEQKEVLGLDAYTDLPYFDSVENLFAAPEMAAANVVNIASPNGYHATHALMALQAGKHVVIEKPMALTKADAEKVIFKALQVQKQVFCVMQNRFSPPSQWIKELLLSGKLGKIFMVQLNCYWNRDDRYYKAESWHGKLDLDGGTLYTQFSHFVDLMYWLFGDITDIQSRFANFNHAHLTELPEDSGVINFKFTDQGIGCINFSTSIWNQNLESSMTIIAEHGSVKIGGQYMDKVETCNVKDYEMPELAPTNPGNDYGAYKGSAANHHFVIENVIDVLKGRAPITVNALEGLKVVEMIGRMYKG